MHLRQPSHLDNTKPFLNRMMNLLLWKITLKGYTYCVLKLTDSIIQAVNPALNASPVTVEAKPHHSSVL